MDFLEDLFELLGRRRRNHRFEADDHDGRYPSANPVYCPNCSAPIVPVARFCQSCGTSISGLPGHNRERRRSKHGFLIKLLIFGLVVVVIILIILIILAAIYAVKNHTQIFEGFSRVIHYIFGDSLDNVIRNLINRGIDEYLRNLFSGSE